MPDATLLTALDLNEFLSVAAEAPSQRDYEAETFRLLRRHVGFDVAYYKRAGGVGEVVEGVDEALVRRYVTGRCSAEGEVVQFAARRQHGVAVDREVLGVRGLERAAYYQVLMKPTGGTCTAFLSFTWLGRPRALMFLGRRGRPFAPREVARLEQLVPALRVSEASRSFAMANESAAPAALTPDLPGLTRAEREVLSYLHLGYSNADIARACGTSPNTIRNQLHSAYAKLGVGSRAEAVAVVLELGASSP